MKVGLKQTFVMGPVAFHRVRSTGLRFEVDLSAVAVCCNVLQCVAVWFEVDLSARLASSFRMKAGWSKQNVICSHSVLAYRLSLSHTHANSNLSLTHTCKLTSVSLTHACKLTSVSHTHMQTDGYCMHVT